MRVRKRDRDRAEKIMLEAATSIDYKQSAVVLDRIVDEKLFGMADLLSLSLASAVMREKASAAAPVEAQP